MYDYREAGNYRIMEQIVKLAGIKIVYKEIPEDIHARTDASVIEMPDNPEAFPDDDQTATLVLGHELGHIISDLGDEIEPSMRARNEAVCDLIGVYLTRLADMIYEHEMEKAFSDDE